MLRFCMSTFLFFFGVNSPTAAVRSRSRTTVNASTLDSWSRSRRSSQGNKIKKRRASLFVGFVTSRRRHQCRNPASFFLRSSRVEIGRFHCVLALRTSCSEKINKHKDDAVVTVGKRPASVISAANRKSANAVVGTLVVGFPNKDSVTWSNLTATDVNIVKESGIR